MSIIEKALAKNDKNPKRIEKVLTSERVTGEPGKKQRVKPDTKIPLHIDLERLTEMGMVSHSDKRVNLSITNSYRSIKQKVIHNAFNTPEIDKNNKNIVMMTSAHPGEGKTFSSINLALSLASETDKTVLLIDADVLKPNVSRTLGVSPKVGLIDYLLNKVEIQDVIYSTSIPNLRLMPAGSSHYLSNELLASDRMEALTKELATRYPDRIIIMDCPPVLGVVETLTLSSLMGQAIIVVEQNKTKLNDVNTAVSQINNDLAIGYILNKTTGGEKSLYSYGSYGYGYGATEK